MSQIATDWERHLSVNIEQCVFGGHTPEQLRVVEKAVAAARCRFADFDRFHPLIAVVAKLFVPDFQEETFVDYLESLYLVAKHGSFVAPLREGLEETVPLISTMKM